MNISYYRSSMRTFWALVYRDLSIFRPFFLEKFVNALIWMGCTVVAFEYVFPQIGMPRMGSFMAVGGIVTWNFFSILHSITAFIGDLEGEKSISYYLTLPISQGLVIVRLAVSAAVQGMMLTALHLPIFKLILGDGLSLANISYIKFFFIYVSYNMMYGALALFFASLVKQLYTVITTWQRYMFPMWYLGCSQFAWFTLYKANPWCAYIDLLNPLVWAMEGTRAAVLGQGDFIDYWKCLGMVWIFTGLALWIGVRRLKKRLDCLI